MPSLLTLTATLRLAAVPVPAETLAGIAERVASPRVGAEVTDRMGTEMPVVEK